MLKKIWTPVNWDKMPIRKPLTFYTILFTYGLSFMAWLFNKPIPSGVESLLSFVVPVVVASYFTSSTFEALKSKEEENK